MFPPPKTAKTYQKQNVWGILIDVYRIHGFINMLVHMEGYMNMWYTTNSWQLYNYYREHDNPLDVVLFPLICRQTQNMDWRFGVLCFSSFVSFPWSRTSLWMEFETYTLLRYGYIHIYIILHLYTAPRNIMMASQQEFYSFREVLWCHHECPMTLARQMWYPHALLWKDELLMLNSTLKS